MKVCTTCGAEYSDDQKFCPEDGSSLRSTAEGDLIGSVIAERYHISKKLGEGGMGAVYLGEHVKMGRKSAIKVMSQSMAHDPDAIARFNREAANAARINHPNVCAIYDFGETPDGTIFLAMEFIEGEALTDVIEREGALSPARATAILEQTAEALQAAHDLEIVHRDLKPDNIMIAAGRAGADLVKVVDFGIAKAIGGEEGQNVTKTGLVVGTPEYMSPEQLSGDQLDGRSDLYSLALVFYRMLTGVLPFQAGSAQETMIKRLTDDPLPLSQARPEMAFPAGLQQVMDRALARMPGERYGSPAEFAADALQAIADMPTAPPSPPADAEGATQLMDTADVTAQVAQTRVAGEPVDLGAGVTEPVEAAAGPTAPIATPTPTTPQPQPSPVPPAKRLPVAAIAAAAIVVAGVGVGTVVLTGNDGGDDGAALDTTSAALDTGGVTEDTAPRLAVNPTSTTDSERTRQVTNGDPPDSDLVQPRETLGVITPPPVVVDSAGLWAELDTLLGQSFEVATRAAAGRRAEQIYEMVGIPRNVKAEAAAIAANVHYDNDNRGRACELMTEARDLMPTVQAYGRSLATWGCTS